MAPVQTDALTGNVTLLPVPEPTLPLRLLLWDTPTKEQWDSVFIDGTRMVKNEAGEEVEESKNWLQRDIVTAALNFGGSPLEQMLNGVEDLEMAGDVAEEPVKHDPNAVAEMQAAATLAAAQAAAQAAIVESNKAMEGQNVPKLVGKVADIVVVDDVVQKAVPDQAAQLAAAQAIIAQLTGQK
jgi:hypothetical protein